MTKDEAANLVAYWQRLAPSDSGPIGVDVFRRNAIEHALRTLIPSGALAAVVPIPVSEVDPEGLILLSHEIVAADDEALYRLRPMLSPDDEVVLRIPVRRIPLRDIRHTQVTEVRQIDRGVSRLHRIWRFDDVAITADDQPDSDERDPAGVLAERIAANLGWSTSISAVEGQ